MDKICITDFSYIKKYKYISRNLVFFTCLYLIIIYSHVIGRNICVPIAILFRYVYYRTVWVITKPCAKLPGNKKSEVNS